MRSTANCGRKRSAIFVRLATRRQHGLQFTTPRHGLNKRCPQFKGFRKVRSRSSRASGSASSCERVLLQIGEARQLTERLREAEIIAERLNDDRRRGQVCAFMTNAYIVLGAADKALVTGARALEIAGVSRLRLRILTTSHLEQANYHRVSIDGSSSLPQATSRRYPRIGSTRLSTAPCLYRSWIGSF